MTSLEMDLAVYSAMRNIFLLLCIHWTFNVAGIYVSTEALSYIHLGLHIVVTMALYIVLSYAGDVSVYSRNGVIQSQESRSDFSRSEETGRGK